MKITRKFAFRVTTLLMLTALTIMPMVSVGAAPDWWWAPGTYHYTCVDGSVRDISICTAPTDVVVTDKNVPYAQKQSYEVEFGSNVSNVVSITIPQSSYSSEEFYIKPMPLGMYLWVQVHAIGDGTGELGLVSGALQDVDISINVTGDGAGGFTTDVSRSGGAAPAGSAVVDMPLNLSVWFSTSPSTNNRFLYLFDMDFSMNITTGFTEVEVIDTSSYPGGLNATIDGYYKNATGVPYDPQDATVTFAGAGAGLDIYFRLWISPPTEYLDLYTDFIFTDIEVLEPITVGGVWTPVDKLALLAPYIALASTIILAVAATAIFFKYRKKP